MTTPRQIKLGMFLRPAGHHIAGWRHKNAWADGGLSFPKYVEMAQTAERGLFDLMFSADALTGERYDRETLSRTSYVAWIEPMSLLTALAAVTRNIGLVCTATTTYDEPYHIARRFASLDLISGGRSGWNLVTSANNAEAENFGRDQHLPKHERYRRAREFVDVVRGLWDSWDDDAFVFDKADGRFYDPDKRHVLDHQIDARIAHVGAVERRLRTKNTFERTSSRRNDEELFRRRRIPCERRERLFHAVGADVYQRIIHIDDLVQIVIDRLGDGLALQFRLRDPRVLRDGRVDIVGLDQALQTDLAFGIAGSVQMCAFGQNFRIGRGDRRAAGDRIDRVVVCLDDVRQ